jgi:hypothetical protein
MVNGYALCNRPGLDAITDLLSRSNSDEIESCADICESDCITMSPVSVDPGVVVASVVVSDGVGFKRHGGAALVH